MTNNSESWCGMVLVLQWFTLKQQPLVAPVVGVGAVIARPRASASRHLARWDQIPRKRQRGSPTCVRSARASASRHLARWDRIPRKRQRGSPTCVRSARASASRHLARWDQIPRKRQRGSPTCVRSATVWTHPPPNTA